jgi:predicted DNA binding CopG/RHH family protein
MSAKTKVPRFKSEAAERRFWEAHDSAELIDWSRAKRVRLPNLKPSTQSISLRLPIHTLERIKAAANARDVPYQSLIKVWLEEKLSTPKRSSARHNPVSPAEWHTAEDEKAYSKL